MTARMVGDTQFVVKRQAGEVWYSQWKKEQPINDNEAGSWYVCYRTIIAKPIKETTQ